MESVYQFKPEELLGFGLVLLRLSTFIFIMPVIGTAQMPNQIKILTALMLTFIVFPTVGWQKLNLSFDNFDIVTYGLKEMFVGVVFGFFTRLFFMVIMMAGHLMSISMGISSAQLFNPSLGETVSPFDQFYTILATLFFLAVNGHHMFLQGIVDTYSIIPLKDISISFAGLPGVADMVTNAMATAVQIGAPIMISILMVNVGMALVGRAVPQINILITSLPVNTLSGMLVMIFTMPLLLGEMGTLLHSTTNEVFNLLKTF